MGVLVFTLVIALFAIGFLLLDRVLLPASPPPQAVVVSQPPSVTRRKMRDLQMDLQKDGFSLSIHTLLYTHKRGGGYEQPQISSIQ